MDTMNGFVTGRLADIGKTKSDLARECHVSLVTMGSKLRGETPLTLREAMVVANYIGCTLTDLADFLRG